MSTTITQCSSCATEPQRVVVCFEWACGYAWTGERELTEIGRVRPYSSGRCLRC